MSEPSPRPDDEPEIADVNWLLGNPTARAPEPAPIEPPRLSADPGEGYEVEGLDPGAAHEDHPPPIPTAPPRVAKPRFQVEGDSSLTPRIVALPETTATVDEVWTRWDEWGTSLILMGLTILASGGLIAFALALNWFGIAFFLLMASGALLLVLMYPIAITLERPVRITPEQAVRDYYAALSHHFPHYRRMWLLLSSAGKTSGSFGSLEGFQRHWEGWIVTLKGNRAGKFTPLKFQVEDFRAEKSAGKTTLPAKFTVNVFIRGEQSSGAVGSYRVDTGLVKGPDKMWYLNDGTLPAGPG